jgi:hypothetical protein
MLDTFRIQERIEFDQSDPTVPAGSIIFNVYPVGREYIYVLGQKNEGLRIFEEVVEDAPS